MLNGARQTVRWLQRSQDAVVIGIVFEVIAAIEDEDGRNRGAGGFAINERDVIAA